MLGITDHGRAPAMNPITTNGTTRLIPDDEPVFLVRGQDVNGGGTVRFWANMANGSGADPEIVRIAREHAEKMDAWPKKKVPDLPSNDQHEGRELTSVPLDAPVGRGEEKMIKNGYVFEVNIYDPAGEIWQDTFSVTNGLKERIMRQVIDTKEQQIREALIRLGWTPPNAKVSGAGTASAGLPG